MKKFFSTFSVRIASVAVGAICGIVILVIIATVSAGEFNVYSSWSAGSTTKLQSSIWNDVVDALATAINDNNTASHANHCNWNGLKCSCAIDNIGSDAVVVIGTYCDPTYRKIYLVKPLWLAFDKKTCPAGSALGCDVITY